MKGENNFFLPSLRLTSPRITSGVFSYGSSAKLNPKFSCTLVSADLILIALLNGWKACENETHAKNKATKTLIITLQ